MAGGVAGTDKRFDRRVLTFAFPSLSLVAAVHWIIREILRGYDGGARPSKISFGVMYSRARTPPPLLLFLPFLSLSLLLFSSRRYLRDRPLPLPSIPLSPLLGIRLQSGTDLSRSTCRRTFSVGLSRGSAGSESLLISETSEKSGKYRISRRSSSLLPPLPASASSRTPTPRN